MLLLLSLLFEGSVVQLCVCLRSFKYLVILWETNPLIELSQHNIVVNFRYLAVI